MFNPLTLGSLTGFLTFALTTYPRSPIAQRRPQIKLFKRIQIQPQLKIFYKKEKAFICHHWLWMLALLIFFFFFFQPLGFLEGFLMGGVGQGLTFKDRFEFKEEIKLSAT